MSTQHFVLIADALRTFRMPNQQWEDLVKHFAKYLHSTNENFKEKRFVDYAMGRGGPSGGSKYKGTAPNAPDTLFA
jgi:hypothetical protein